ncbi:hypothetical protein C818_01200 [Lachnospiraceae bacterium MD308]|nr:hypothetical protein C818_01200 [Lachnospiraceae bacterium MD308]
MQPSTHSGNSVDRRDWQSKMEQLKTLLNEGRSYD